MLPRNEEGICNAEGRTDHYYGWISLKKSETSNAEGLLSTDFTSERLTHAIRAPKNFGSKQTKIQKKSFLFPELQETKDATVVLEFMKIELSNL